MVRKMLSAARKNEVLDDSVGEVPRRLGLATCDAVAVASPVRALQQRVESNFSECYPEPHVAKWPAASRLLFITASTGIVWSGLVFGVKALFRI